MKNAIVGGITAVIMICLAYILIQVGLMFLDFVIFIMSHNIGG